MNKRAIAILGVIFLLIVGTLGFLIYAKYSGGKAKTPAAPSLSQTATSTSTPNSTASTTPPSTSQGIGQLTTDQVVSPALFFNDSGITYFDNQGNLYQSTLQTSNGQLELTDKKQLDIPVKANITKILWPQKGNDFIAEITDPATQKISWSYFNSNSGAYTDLPPQVESVDWMPDGTRIAYVWLANGKASLSMGNPDATSYKTLAPMWETDDTLSVSPDGSQILYYETNNTGLTNAINSVSIDGKVWKGLVKSGQNFGVLWSPDGQKFLFGKKDPATLQYQLWYYNLTSGETENLGLFTTVDKAVWAGDSNIIYAAVPNSTSPAQGSLTSDSFYSLNTSTLAKQQYGVGVTTAIDGQDLFLNSSGNDLFFKNAQDGGLYYLDLSQQ